MEIVATPPPLGHEGLHAPSHGHGHADGSLSRVRHFTGSLKKTIRPSPAKCSRVPSHSKMSRPISRWYSWSHAHDLFRRRRLREGGEAAQVHEDHRDLPAVALERILRAPADMSSASCGEKKRLSRPRRLELGHLRLHALLEIAVEVGELGRLGLDGGVEVLDPQQRPDGARPARPC